MPRRSLNCLSAIILSAFLTLYVASAFAVEIDITDYVELQKSRLVSDRRTGKQTLDVALLNLSSETVLEPIRVVITSISSSAVTVNNADGTTPEGYPFFTYNADIEPGETSAARSWEFGNPSRVRFIYTVQILAQLPVSAPVVTFSATPQGIDAGQSATLTWTSTRADTCTIEPEIGDVPVNGSCVVSPEQTTTYTITAIGAGGSISSEITITIPDSDGDGLPDEWEIQHFGNTAALRDGDNDGDGVSNYIEYKINTDPADFASRPDTGMYCNYDDTGRMIAVFIVKSAGDGYEVRYSYDGLSRRTKTKIHRIQQ